MICRSSAFLIPYLPSSPHFGYMLPTSPSLLLFLLCCVVPLLDTRVQEPLQRKVTQMRRTPQEPGCRVPLASLRLCPPACCPHGLLRAPPVAYPPSSQPEAMLLNVACTYVMLGSCLNCPPLCRMPGLDPEMETKLPSVP